MSLGLDPERIGWLHLRPQFTYHAEATIVGTRHGIEALRDAVEAALSGGQGEACVFASDGEGYELTVRCSSTVRGIGKPTYLDQEARELASYEREYLIRETKARRQQDREAYAALRWCRANGNPHSPFSDSDTQPKAGDAQQGSARE